MDLNLFFSDLKFWKLKDGKKSEKIVSMQKTGLSGRLCFNQNKTRK